MPSSKQALIKKLGSEEAYLEYMRNLGKKGGATQTSKGSNKYRALTARKPKRPCKFCGSMAHFPHRCPMNPKNQSGRLTRATSQPL